MQTKSVVQGLKIMVFNNLIEMFNVAQNEVYDLWLRAAVRDLAAVK